jgi:hypothetical protein
MLRIIRKFLHPIAQLRRMKVFCGLRIRDAALLDQPLSSSYRRITRASNNA